MKPGDLVLVRAVGIGNGREFIEGAAELVRVVNAGHGDGRERWHVRFLDGSDLRSREVLESDVVEERELLEERIAAAEMELDARDPMRWRR